MMLVFLALLISTVSWGTTTIVSITEESATRVVPKDGTTDWIVYAGVAGTCTGTETSTCNSCSTEVKDLSTVEPCNPRRIHSTLKLTITIRSDSAEVAGGQPLLAIDETPDVVISGTSTPTVTANTDITFDVPWSSICGAISSDNTDCAGLTESKTLLVGFRKSGVTDATFADGSQKITLNVQNMTADSARNHGDCFKDTGLTGGFCKFTILPADKKIYVEAADLKDADTKIAFGDKNLRALHLYCNEIPKEYCDCKEGGSCTGTNPSNLFTDNVLPINLTTDLCLEAEFTTSSSEINFLNGSPIQSKDLLNETCYGFIMATADEARNVGYFTPTGFDQDNFTNQVIVGRPTLVVGALPDKQCAIVTLFGGRWPTQVFRQFRDRYLTPFWLGRQIAYLYYEISTLIVASLQNSAWLATVVRMVLYPVALLLSQIEWLAGVLLLLFLGLRIRRRIA